MNNKWRAFIAFILLLFLEHVMACRADQIKLVPKSLYISELTWPELVTYVNQGYITAIVPSGGMEQNGLHMVIGKHDKIIEHTTRIVAQKLGNALIAPIISYVPQGQFSPATENMRFPGTIGLTETAYESLLDGIVRSLKKSGFKIICLIADHGGSLNAQQKVANKLNHEWKVENIHVINVTEYYQAGSEQIKYLQKMQLSRDEIGDHAGMLDTSELMYVYPRGVDLSLLQNTTIPSDLRGDSGNPNKSTPIIGDDLIKIKVNAAVKQIEIESQY